MSQMRKDIFTGSWVIVAESDVIRPSDFSFKKFTRDTTFCPFCETNEASTPPEIFAMRRPGLPANGPGWSVRVVSSSKPRLKIEGELGRRPDGIHDVMNGVGADEVIAETPRHDRSLPELDVPDIANVIRAWISRTTDLEGDPRLRYTFIYKNHGEEAGARTITHSISQLIAMAITPRAVKTKLMVAREYFGLKERCLYCDVLKQELENGSRLITENADFVVLAPYASRAAFEMYLISKVHQSAFSRMAGAQIETFASILREVLQRLDNTVIGAPYNLLLFDRPYLRKREGYWNTIEEDFHWHLQILPQIVRPTGLERGSWFYYNPVPPELAARCLSA